MWPLKIGWFIIILCQKHFLGFRSTTKHWKICEKTNLVSVNQSFSRVCRVSFLINLFHQTHPSSYRSRVPVPSLAYSTYWWFNLKFIFILTNWSFVFRFSRSFTIMFRFVIWRHSLLHRSDSDEKSEKHRLSRFLHVNREKMRWYLRWWTNIVHCFTSIFYIPIKRLTIEQVERSFTFIRSDSFRLLSVT